eukprot:TRINITY_DN6732_c0_g1_i10.p1 TRINITY_DN6732_c0_g1~~TRINITY_DN6732_c0_g1_i10.p1  ORF type:complete len:119 (-),score=19.81 TRINITY_DN6732_c0_g1_i10:159-515(-)
MNLAKWFLYHSYLGTDPQSLAISPLLPTFHHLFTLFCQTGAIDEDADQEELALDVVEFSVGDYFSKVSAPSFTEAWNGLGESGQAVTTFSLSTVSNLTRVFVLENSSFDGSLTISQKV